MGIRIQDFLRAFPNQPEVARKLAGAIDAGQRGDGDLSDAELKAAIASLRADGFAAGALKAGFQELFGRDLATAPPSVRAFGAEVRTELAAKGISQQDLLFDLRVLSKDPTMAVREAGSPEYLKAAQWVADQLRAAGVEPMGDSGPSAPSFFQKFKWEERFAPSRVSSSVNVVGRIPGKGPEPREAVLIIAHLDNLSKAEKADYLRRDGRDLRVYEGANDNTASVAALLETVRALKEAGPTNRDIIVLVPSAEEDGLKGTEAFVKGAPVPLDRIVGAVNLEMIGQNSTSELLLYGGQSETEASSNPLYSRAKRVAEASGAQVKPGHLNDDGEGWYGRSDHLVTANAGIPSVMFHGRTASGNYHTSDDTVENLNLEKVEVVSRQVLRLVRDLANDPQAAERRGPARATLNPYPGQVWPGE